MNWADEIRYHRFGFHTTAADVVARIGVPGKQVMVTAVALGLGEAVQMPA
jgi:hypothetical protein